MIKAENRFPEFILNKSIKSGNELGWKQNDFLEVVETARKNFIAIFGGQIQYAFPGCTYELYWLSYDPDERQLKEEWVTYCNRTAKECMDNSID
jgi:hypothetical protein